MDMGYLFPAAPVLPGWDVTGAAERSYLTSEVRGCGREELPMPEVRGSGWEGLSMPEVRGSD